MDNFPRCWQLCGAASKAIKGVSTESVLLGCGWAQQSVGCLIWYQAWSHRPAFTRGQVSRPLLAESAFSFQLDTPEFALLEKCIILTCILFGLKKYWPLQGACCRESRASFKVLAWGLLTLGSKSWVLAAFKQKPLQTWVKMLGEDSEWWDTVTGQIFNPDAKRSWLCRFSWVVMCCMLETLTAPDSLPREAQKYFSRGGGKRGRKREILCSFAWSMLYFFGLMFGNTSTVGN